MSHQAILTSRSMGRIRWASQAIDPARWLLPAVALLAACVARLTSAANVDVSGLLTWSEKMLDGARPYIDFIEINPPG